MSLYPQAPQSIGRVLDAGLQLYRRSLKSVLVLSFVAAALAQAPQLLQLMLLDGRPPGAAIVAVGVLGFLVWIAVYLALYNGLLKSIDEVARGRPALGLGGALSAGMPKVLTTLGATILYGLAVMAGMVLLLVPGIILAGSLLMFWYLIMLEDAGALESLKRSHALVWGNWWRTTTVVFVAALIYFVGVLAVGGGLGVALGIGFGAGVSGAGIEKSPGAIMIVMTLIQVALNAVLMPMWNSMMLVQFRDLQLRKSGSDLAARAAAL